MSRHVCFIDDEGQVATCLNQENDSDCDTCPYDTTAHFAFITKMKKPRGDPNV